MVEADRHLWEYRWFRDAVALLAVLLILWFLYEMQSVAVPVLIGFALAYALNPPVTWAKHRLHIPRLVSGLLILGVGLAAVSLLIVFFLPSLVEQAQLLTGRLGVYAAWIVEHSQELWERLVQRTLGAVAPQAATAPAVVGAPVAPTAAATAPAPTGEMTGPDLGTAGNLVMRVLGIGVGVVGTAVGVGTYLAVALVVVIFCFLVFLWHFERILNWFAQFIPAPSREHALHISRRIDRALSGFIRGRMVQAGIMTVNLAIGWKLAGVPFWLLLAAMSGILNLIPYTAVLGCLLAVSLTLVDQLSGSGGAASSAGFPWAALIWPTVAYLLAQLVDGWVVEPLVQGKATDLNSLTVLLAVVTGASVAGLLGMLLAIPVTACLKILAEELLLPRLRAYAQAAPPPAGP